MGHAYDHGVPIHRHGGAEPLLLTHTPRVASRQLFNQLQLARVDGRAGKRIDLLRDFGENLRAYVCEGEQHTKRERDPSRSAEARRNHHVRPELDSRGDQSSLDDKSFIRAQIKSHNLLMIFFLSGNLRCLVLGADEDWPLLKWSYVRGAAFYLTPRTFALVYYCYTFLYCAFSIVFFIAGSAPFPSSPAPAFSNASSTPSGASGSASSCK